jgi:hypothetical protein
VSTETCCKSHHYEGCADGAPGCCANCPTNPVRSRRTGRTAKEARDRLRAEVTRPQPTPSAEVEALAAELRSSLMVPCEDGKGGHLFRAATHLEIARDPRCPMSAPLVERLREALESHAVHYGNQRWVMRCSAGRGCPRAVVHRRTSATCARVFAFAQGHAR